MFWFSTPKIFLLAFAFVGSLTLSYFLAKAFHIIYERIITGSWPKDPDQYRYFLLQQENIRLNKKIQALEEENAEILNSIINQIKGH